VLFRTGGMSIVGLTALALNIFAVLLLSRYVDVK
jgi:hypothetical protein